MQLHESLLDKLDHEVHILMSMYETGADDEAHARLMVDQAKRVRRVSTMLVKALAQQRDTNATA